MSLYSGSLILGNIDNHFQYRHTSDRYDPFDKLDAGMAGWYRAMIVDYETLVEAGNISSGNARVNIADAYELLGRQGIIDHLSRAGLSPIPTLPPVQGPCYPPPNPFWPASNEVRPRRNGETCHRCGSIWNTYGWGGASCNDCSGFL